MKWKLSNFWGQKGLGREITYMNKIGNEFVQMGNKHLLERQNEHFVIRQSTRW